MVMMGAIVTEGYLWRERRMKRLSSGQMGCFSRPPFARTEKGCFFPDHANPNVVMDQADAYFSALTQGERYRVADDRLEILDGEGATRLVLVREAPLPGQPVDLRGTSWRLITVDDVDNDERVTTLIFNGRQGYRVDCLRRLSCLV